MFFFNDAATTEIYTLSLHDALPISSSRAAAVVRRKTWPTRRSIASSSSCRRSEEHTSALQSPCNLVCRLLLDNNDLRDYFRDIGRMVLAAERRKANDSHADCYQYFS